MAQSLHALIRSLSQPEKRHFKVFLKRKIGEDSNNAIKLFDELNDQDDYQEEKLTHFPHFAVLKMRLEESILLSLQDFRSGKSVSAKLKSSLLSVEILFQKGLLENAKRQIDKAKKMAERYEEHLALFELYFWELKLINSQGFGSTSESHMQKAYKNASDCIGKAENKFQFALLSNSIYMGLRKHGFLRNKKDIKKYREIMRHPLLRAAGKAHSVFAKFYYYSSHSGYAELQGDYHGAKKNTDLLLKLLEEHSYLLQKDPQLYLSVQHNSIVFDQQLKNYELSLAGIEKLKRFVIENLKPLSDNLVSRLIYFTNTTMLEAYCRIGEYERAVSEIPEVKNDFAKYCKRIPNKEVEWMFYDAAAASYFGEGKFAESLQYINRIIRDRTEGIRPDLQSKSYILSLILHYEMKNLELLPYMVKWTYRFLLKQNRLYKFETIVLEFIRKKIHLIDSRPKMISLFSELKNELIKLLPDVYERRPLEDFQYIEWLESKIQNRPFAEIVRGRIKRPL